MSHKLKLSPEYSGWLELAGLRRLFSTLKIHGEETRVNGGAVRNSILGEPVKDIDLSTTLEPDIVLNKLKKTGIKTITTGLSHGTVTAIINDRSYEITTLRRDVKTDGRHAIVAFGRDWKEDAKRRDLTINALYCNQYGEIFDPLNVYEDLINHSVRFIGKAEERIKEDHLRILRFFRFYAQYGKGRPDSEALKACARLKNSISSLSVERVWIELKRILGTQDPSRTLLWMRATGVLGIILPESEKWGIDFVSTRVLLERELIWKPEAMERLQTIIPPYFDTVRIMASRLRLSTKEKMRMLEWTKAILPDLTMNRAELEKFLYYGSPQAVCDRIKNEIIHQKYGIREKNNGPINIRKLVKLLRYTQKWKRPVFPLKGRDLIGLNMKPGKQIGRVLKHLEREWVKSGFTYSQSDLLEKLKT